MRAGLDSTSKEEVAFYARKADLQLDSFLLEGGLQLMWMVYSARGAVLGGLNH